MSVNLTNGTSLNTSLKVPDLSQATSSGLSSQIQSMLADSNFAAAVKSAVEASPTNPETAAQTGEAVKAAQAALPPNVSKGVESFLLLFAPMMLASSGGGMRLVAGAIAGYQFGKAHGLNEEKSALAGAMLAGALGPVGGMMTGLIGAQLMVGNLKNSGVLSS